MIRGVPDKCASCRYSSDLNGQPGCAFYQQHFFTATEPLCEGRHFAARAPFTWPPVDRPH